MTFYELLVFIHILSAILGMGPGFVMIITVKKANNMTELRHAYQIRNRLHIFTMVLDESCLISRRFGIRSIGVITTVQAN